MTDSFVVYRNPVEAAIWDSVMNNPMIVVHVLMFIVLSLVLTAVIVSWYEKLDSKYFHFSRKKNDVITKIIILISIVFSGWISFFVIPSL